ncbi:SurA N-terminal domain-containing protein [Kribbella endophytica]
MSRKLAHVAGAALASVLLLGGCAAGTHPGAAAVVGGTEITVGDVDETSRSVTTALGQPFTASLALSELVNSALVQQVANQRSVTVTDAELAPAMKAVVGDQAAYDKFVADPVAEEFLRGVAKAAVGTIKLGGGTGITDPNVQQAQQAGLVVVKDAAKNITVDVSPRFGKWTDGAIDGKVSGSLSEESAQAKAKREAAEQQQQQQQQQQPQG